ncbi:LppX_LprAFG lipoprotein [Mycobacterium koreense]|nr:LppX_LprAFG lipoprotein [Mycolicibacillus koreensis]MCV7247650.1 LppX_LprAFG lipoprotein [Mycolicibacillus koreensis]BBY54033.1 hypothetical protein MKOR_12840 [Mycolicibacillus koreensis]
MQPEAHADTTADTTQQVVDTAASALRDAASIHVFYTTSGLDELTATVYSADITAAPPTASGDASLLVDGERVHTGFRVDGGQLWLGTTDGGEVDAGRSAGQFDPTALLGRSSGLAALLAQAQELREADDNDAADDLDTVKIEAAVPAAATSALLPADAREGRNGLPATLWIARDSGQLQRLVLRVGEATAAVKITRYDAAGSADDSTVTLPPN